MKSKQYRVVIVEPSFIIAQGLKNAIEPSSTFLVVGILSDFTHLEERLTPLRADLVIVNPTMAEFHKRNQVRSLFSTTTVVALLYNYIDSSLLDQFAGVIDIYDEPSKILQRLDIACRSSSQEEVIPAEGGDLSDREKEILVAVAKGMMNKEIATLYNLSIHTVISHRKNISRKTGIKSISGFVVYALLNNLVEEHEIQ